MIYQILSHSDRQMVVALHPRARRGRGFLFALAPIVAYTLLVSLLFAASIWDIRFGRALVGLATFGAVAALALSALAFVLGYRAKTRVEVTRAALRVLRTPSVGGDRLLELERPRLAALAIELSLRSLGADYVLVAFDQQGCRIPIIEGDPHSGQLRSLAEEMASIVDVPLILSSSGRESG
jgi:hypothetical protein